MQFLHSIISWFSPILITTLEFFTTKISHVINFHHRWLTVENTASTDVGDTSLLDLPELALDSILERLSPSELCSMTGVSSYLRDRCVRNEFWVQHMRMKWGGLMGNVAHKKWQLFSGGNNESTNLYLQSDSIMAWYLSLENGEFWFPGQVYNREGGHDCFMLSCYDAEVSHDVKTNTFRARYWSPLDERVEEDVSWGRLRAPPIDIPPYDLHSSDCLKCLKPGDHVEIQWRKNNRCPYGWWYGVIGHLEFCSGDEYHCVCNHSNMVVVEFNQYSHGSRWRILKLNRGAHREVGNDFAGFYGGVRKLESQDEINKWKDLWPSKVID